MSGTQLVASGPLILALPVAAAAGAVTFLSPCCLPLVPGYLSFVTGMAGAGGGPAAAASARGAAARAADGAPPAAVPAQAPSVAAADGSGVAVAAPPLAATASTLRPQSPRGRVV